MITFFTTAKPFTGHTAVIQRNALQSWLAIAPDAEVLLFGDDAGAAEIARELSIRHVPAIERVPEGPKVLRSLFQEAQRIAKHDVLCYANCDIVMTHGLRHAINVVEMIRNEFLMVGRRWNLNQDEPLSMSDRRWEEQIMLRAQTEGHQVSGDWIDYFVFRKGLYDVLPHLVIGRVFWDQWLVWRARDDGAAVVDATNTLMAIHQNHDYGYHAAGKAGVWGDQLSRRNYALAGGRWNLCTIDDATHVLGPDGLRPNPARLRRTANRFIQNVKNEAREQVVHYGRLLLSATTLSKRVDL